jgi:hypothetical protein
MARTGTRGEEMVGAGVIALAVCGVLVMAATGVSPAPARLSLEGTTKFYTSADAIGWPHVYMAYIESHPGASPEAFFAAEATRAAAAAAAVGATAARAPRAQQLVFVNSDLFAGHQGLPSQYQSGGSWMDGSRGTEHLPHSLLKTLQQREAAAGIQGDEEGARNFQSGEGLDMENGGKPVPPVQAW